MELRAGPNSVVEVLRMAPNPYELVGSPSTSRFPVDTSIDSREPKEYPSESHTKSTLDRSGVHYGVVVSNRVHIRFGVAEKGYKCNTTRFLPKLDEVV